MTKSNKNRLNERLIAAGTILTLLIILLCCAGCPHNDVPPILEYKGEPYIPERGDKEKLSFENRVIVEQRAKKVQAELETLQEHPWAGSYDIHSGVPPVGKYRFLIAPKSGYIYTSNSDDWVDAYGGVLYDQNYGGATWENDRLKLSPVLKNEDNGYYNPGTEFVLIPWEERLYLVPADGIVEFCNAVNSGWVHYFSRGGNWKHPEGKPDVPDNFKPYLLETPIEGQVIALGKTEDVQRGEYRGQPWMLKETTVTINKGKQDGLLSGMKFYVMDSEFSEWIELTDVSETESEGIFTWRDERSAPQTGWSVSTTSRW